MAIQHDELWWTNNKNGLYFIQQVATCLTSSAAAFLEQQISNCESRAHQEVNTLLPMHENKKGTREYLKILSFIRP